jgi:hypothetical protein
VSDSEELARKERRRRLIARLNADETLLGGKHSTQGLAQMSEEELEAEIERQRQEHYSRRGFGQMF